MNQPVPTKDNPLFLLPLLPFLAVPAGLVGLYGAYKGAQWFQERRGVLIALGAGAVVVAVAGPPAVKWVKSQMEK